MTFVMFLMGFMTKTPFKMWYFAMGCDTLLLITAMITGRI